MAIAAVAMGLTEIGQLAMKSVKEIQDDEHAELAEAMGDVTLAQ